MKDSPHDDATDAHIGLPGPKPAVQVICLGSGGGPSEDNVTGFLVRSIGSEWARGSMLAVDAGSHLAPITRMLERSFPSVSGDHPRSDSNGRADTHASNGGSRSVDRTSVSPLEEHPPKPEPTILSEGPFAGLKFPNESARANALHVLRTLVSAYLITHPHLDHLSGFAINTAAFHATSRPKTLAALPSTVNAIKDHIFNDIIWPNLTDEDGGVGFVTFQRLKEGGDLMVGDGEGRGYIDVCDGLGVKAFKVSHGTCTKSPPSHQHRTSIAGGSDSQPLYNGSISGSVQDAAAAAMSRSMSISHQSHPGTPGARPSYHGSHQSPHLAPDSESCVVDSTAFFLRDEFTQREVLMFGDVEPDSISLAPRNHIVWREAARKIAHAMLGAIFIECSYDDSQADALLFGHLCPRHLIAELQELARCTVEARQAVQAERASKKRKRSGPNGLDNLARAALGEDELSRKRSRSLVNRPLHLDERRRSSAPDSRALPNHNSSTPPPAPVSTPPASDTSNPYDSLDGLTHHLDPTISTSPQSATASAPQNSHGSSTTTTAAAAAAEQDIVPPPPPPLGGLRVIIIHVKDTLRDGPHVGDRILAELREHEAGLRERGEALGCEFAVAASGESYWI